MRARLNIEEYQRRLAVEQQRMRCFTVAAESERRIAAKLAAMAGWGWELLPDRRWPNSRNANVDMIHVGPGGVFVVDVKAWAEPRVEHGLLYRGDADASDEVDTLLAVTSMVEQVAGERGLVPVAVVPVIVLAGEFRGVTELGRVVVLGESDVVPWLHRRGARLAGADVAAISQVLGAAFPAYDEPLPEVARVADPAPVLPRVVETPELFDAGELEAALLESAAAQPIESWMTFLHPSQVRLVRRRWNGPARLRGPAGTGKSVVGLHRAAYLAATRPGRILVTSYVRTVPDVLGGLYERLAPETADRVEFVNLHRWAKRFLDERGIRHDLDSGAIRSAFARAWAATGARTTLASVAPYDYWREEVDYVIKGRGLTEFEAYADLSRVGRRTALSREQRVAVWELYCAYDRELRQAGKCDFNDVLLMALAEVRREPLDPAYAAVVVDEVQDLTRVGVELAHALVGDLPDGLLLIGDGQQAIYPGGFTLAEAGIAVAGRAAVLRTNYRNAAEILEAASALVADDTFDDLDGEPEHGRRDIETLRRGGRTTMCSTGETSQDAALVAAVREAQDGGRAYGDMAVLVSTKAQVRHYLAVLKRFGIPAQSLETYAGRATGEVKVGTFKRAKGLEFAAVFLPRFGSPMARQVTPDAVALARRERYVAMTRARDLLWVGTIEPAADAVPA